MEATLQIDSSFFAQVAFLLPQVITNPVVAAIATVAGTSLTVVGLIMARRYRVNPRMVYQMHDSFVVGLHNATSLGDIKIMFNGESVPRVVVTQLGIWNAVDTTVAGSDIAKGDPIAVTISDGSSILGATRLNVTHEVNDCRIRLADADRSRALVKFEYLNAGDGALFQIIHTGAINKAKVGGSLKGIPRGVEDWGRTEMAFNPCISPRYPRSSPKCSWA